MIGLLRADEKQPKFEDYGEIVLPSVGFGTAGLGGTTHDTVLQSLKLGVRMIDSAQAQEWYQEQGVGSGITAFKAENSEKIYIVTKVHPRSFGLEKMDSRLALSREYLQSDTLDAVLLHSPWCWPGHCSTEEQKIGWQSGWKHLEELKEKHHIHNIGVSNFHLDLMKDLVANVATKKVSTVQNWMDPFHQDRGVREFAQHHGIQYMAYSSLGTQWGNANKRRLAALGITGNPVLNSPVLQDIAQKHASSVPQVVLAWLLAEGVVAIPRTSNAEHMQDNFAFLNAAQNCDGRESDRSAEDDATSTCSIVTPVNLDADDLSRIRSLDGSIGDLWDS
eukprot:CAMPEP_0174985848 /NCGR_PEP_ID=MMETSP0004_2-20121128/18584_1 /TAXON_ID=420556 /ORGANISM="Ochromonas sp., Strain CCMP1393" /LENGTH=333 /DNA_ID=CAMNT_0016238571 /DNA_START=435 /DNA_END=1436 /DNA_ORIENTATION=+